MHILRVALVPIDEREDRRIRADVERQQEESDQSKGGASTEAAEYMLRVPARPSKNSGDPHLLTSRSREWEQLYRGGARVAVNEGLGIEPDGA